MTVAYKPESVVLGLALIALGVLWTLSNLGALDLLRTLRTWLPSSLIVWGLLELADSLARRSGNRR